MKNYTSCKPIEQRDGNLLQWKQFTPDERGIIVETQPLETYCPKFLTLSGRPAINGLVGPTRAILPGRRIFQSSHTVCRAFQSTVFTYNDTIKNIFPEIKENIGNNYWTGFILKDDTNSTYIAEGNINLNQTDLQFTEGFPSGGKDSPCIAFSGDLVHIEDRPCNENMYTTCSLDQVPSFTLQNHAKVTAILRYLHSVDPELIVRFGNSDPEEDFKLLSPSGHRIVRVGETWEMKDIQFKSLLTMSSTKLPVGLQMWEDVSTKEVIYLNINSCQVACVFIYICILFLPLILRV